MIARNAVSACLLILTATAPTAGQTGGWSPEDEEGVRAAALDYMEGALNADADRVARGVHQELNKVIVVTPPGFQGQVLSYNTQSTLVEGIRGAASQLAGLPKDVEVTVFDIDGDLATARAIGMPWYDTMQLARINGEWKIVNVLWSQNRLNTPGGGANSDEDRAAAEALALDYIDGSYSGNAERVGRAMHPEFHKVRLVTHPGTGIQFLQKIGFSVQVEGTAAGVGTLPEADRNIQVEVFDVSHDMAVAKVTSAQSIDYVQMAKVNGSWKLINVLWIPNPEASDPA